MGTLGRYVVQEEVGRGGMGRVLRAYDPELHRPVALKELRADALGGHASARLVLEAQAMAKLSHPNVVAVYDVETLEDGGVVIVMEYVDGTTLRRWLDDERPSWAQILRRYRLAGAGLAAAHAAGLLHRDFKPANVLVAPGVVKVTDFGLAKVDPTASGDGEIDAPADVNLTRTGTVMGTPRYMAPEQHRGARLTAAADQFAFCVALWTALNDEPPFAGETIDALYEAKLGGPRPWKAARVPGPVVEALTRGLSVDPAARWPAMEPLLAALAPRPPGRAALAVAGVAAVGLLTAGLLTDPAGGVCSGASDRLAGAWDGARRKEVAAAIRGTELAYAESTWADVVDELDRYAAAWTATHRDACEASARDEQTMEMLDLRMACLRRAREALVTATEAFRGADADVVANAAAILDGLPPLARCSDAVFLSGDRDAPPPAEAAAVDRARTLLAAAAVDRRAGRPEAARTGVEAARRALEGVTYGRVLAEAALEEALVLDDFGDRIAAATALEDALERATAAGHVDVIQAAASALVHVLGSHLQRPEEGLRYVEAARTFPSGDVVREATFRINFAAALHVAGRYEEAEAEHREALALLVAEFGPDSVRTAAVHNDLALVLVDRGDYEEAEAEARLSIRLWEGAYGGDHPSAAEAHDNLAGILSAAGRESEAEQEYKTALETLERVLGPRHMKTLAARDNLAGCWSDQGDQVRAEAAHRAVLEDWIDLLGPDHPETAVSRLNLATALLRQGELQEAEGLYRSAYQALAIYLGPEHPTTDAAEGNLAVVLSMQDKYAEAEKLNRRLLLRREATLLPGHTKIIYARVNRAHALRMLGRLEEAESEYRRSIEEIKTRHGSESPMLPPTLVGLAKALAELGRLDDAETQFRRALEQRLASLPEDHPDVALSRQLLAQHLNEHGDRGEALELAEAAWVRRQGEGIPPGQRGTTAFLLAKLLWPRGERRRARALAELAADTFEQIDDAPYLAEVRAWIDAHR